MKKTEKKELLKNFIEKNNIRFVEGERNTDSTTISGYALHLGITTTSLIVEVVVENCNHRDYGWKNELYKVFKFAKDNNYGAWWSTREARSMYEFPA